MTVCFLFRNARVSNEFRREPRRAYASETMAGTIVMRHGGTESRGRRCARRTRVGKDGGTTIKEIIFSLRSIQDRKQENNTRADVSSGGIE